MCHPDNWIGLKIVEKFIDGAVFFWAWWGLVRWPEHLIHRRPIAAIGRGLLIAIGLLVGAYGLRFGWVSLWL